MSKNNKTINITFGAIVIALFTILVIVDRQTIGMLSGSLFFLKSMLLHLSKVFGSYLNEHNCTGTLKLTSRYLNKYCKSKEQYNRLINYIKENDGHCDCEMLLNCPIEMEKSKLVFRKI